MGFSGQVEQKSLTLLLDFINSSVSVDINQEYSRKRSRSGCMSKITKPPKSGGFVFQIERILSLPALHFELRERVRQCRLHHR
jgi:hypothetical protein